MRIFILGTGRNGSKTIAKACRHSTNYTAAHESLSRNFGAARFAYPDNHIESDNRLSWELGHLEKHFGDEACYVHLKRDKEEVARSYQRRICQPDSIIDAFCSGIRMSPIERMDEPMQLEVCRDYVDTVTANINHFLASKSRVMTIHLASIEQQFPEFWQWIGAEGDLQKALAELTKRHNHTTKRRLKVKQRLKLYLRREYQHVKLWFNS